MSNKSYYGWMARNQGEHDIENISLYRTKEKALRLWRGRQELVPIVIVVGDAAEALRQQDTSLSEAQERIAELESELNRCQDAFDNRSQY